ncbi:MAG: AEC family transporter [Lentisphaeria bacterium]|nr:AEC family transporter [Lentisphaeria bacterium]
MGWKVFLAIVETCVLFAVGGGALRAGYIGRDDIERWSRFTFNVFTPCLTFAAIAGGLGRDELAALWIMPVAGFGMMAAGAGLGFLLGPLLRYRNRERSATFLHICAINNYIFLPLIVVENIFGFGRHAALLMVMNVGSTVGFWTIGVITLTGMRRDTLRDAVRQIFSINIIAVAAALAVLLLKVPVPAPAMKIVRTLGSLAIPLTIILTGAALYRDARGLFAHKADVAIVAAVRLVLIPAVMIAVLKLLPLPREIYEVCFVVALMPAPGSSALVAGVYGGDGEFASQSVIVTTLLAMATVPLWVRLI